MLYTRTGDDGTSRLFANKKKLPKDNLIFEALGSIDELNSWLGVCRSQAGGVKTKINIANNLLYVQECLFIVQAELAGANKFITTSHISKLEKITAELEKQLKSPLSFVIPGATELSASCDFARTIARRVERRIISAKNLQTVSLTTLAYLNRLSSFLYALARYYSQVEGINEMSPSY